jgi:hypothetical protein
MVEFQMREAERSVEAAHATPLTREQIALCAYHIWQAEGHPERRAVEHWLQAELQLCADRLEVINASNDPLAVTWMKLS